jgi:hypothetical protein
MLSTTTSPSSPAFSAICLAGLRRAAATMSKPIFSSPLAWRLPFSTASIARGTRRRRRDDAFLGGGLGGVERVVDQVLALLHLGLGRGAGA